MPREKEKPPARLKARPLWNEGDNVSAYDFYRLSRENYPEESRREAAEVVTLKKRPPV